MTASRELADLEPSLVQDSTMADEGERVLAWTRINMPLLRRLHAQFEADQPLVGRRIGMCLHVEAKTAVLVQVPRAGDRDQRQPHQAPL